MSIADDVEKEIREAVGPVLASGIMSGSFRFMNIQREELTKDNIEELINALKASLPMFLGQSAVEGLIEKIRHSVEGAGGWRY